MIRVFLSYKIPFRNDLKITHPCMDGHSFISVKKFTEEEIVKVVNSTLVPSAVESYKKAGGNPADLGSFTILSVTKLDG